MRKSDTPSARAAISTAIARCKQGLFGVGAFSALMNVLLLTGPFFMLQIYDRVLTSRSVPTLVALAAIAMLLYLFYGAFDWTRGRLLARLGKAFDRSLAAEAFHHTTQGPHLWGVKPEMLTGNATRDLQEVQRFIGGPAMATLFDIPWFPVYLGVIFLLHPSLGVLALVAAVALLVVAAGNQVFSQKANAQAAALSTAEETIALAGRHQFETLAAMGMGPEVRRLWHKQHDARLDAQAAAIDRQAIFASASKTLRLVFQSAMLGFGAYLVIGNELSAGALIAASIIFARALAPVDQTISQWRTISSAHAAYKRLRSALEKPALKDIDTALALPERSLAVSEFSVAEPSKSTVLLEDANFNLEAGDALGIIGPSGSGKTSLLKGLIGLWPAATGDVRLDGATLDQWSTDRRGKIVGYLPQNIELFPGTIAQNIARFQAGAASEDVLAAAHLARVHELIVGLPDGFDTVVGPGGHALSGGERQRIALARAVFGTPFLVVLDEPNSNMDGSGERALSTTIRTLREKGSIVIVVTHRNAALSEVNKLLLIEARQQVLFGETRHVLNEMRKRKPARKPLTAKQGGLHVVA